MIQPKRANNGACRVGDRDEADEKGEEVGWEQAGGEISSFQVTICLKKFDSHFSSAWLLLLCFGSLFTGSYLTAL